MNQLENKILLPNFLLNYKCNLKGCCCRGWKITFKEYDFLKLKQRIQGSQLAHYFDKFFTFQSSATQEEKVFFKVFRSPFLTKRFGDGFATVKFDSRGVCPFLMDDGKCYIHKEFGEEYLPEICINFPIIGIETPAGIELYFEFICPEVYKTLYEFKEKPKIAEIERKWKRDVIYFSPFNPIENIDICENFSISFEDFHNLRKLLIEIITTENEPFLKRVSIINSIINEIIEKKGVIEDYSLQLKGDERFVSYLRELMTEETKKIQIAVESLKSCAHFFVDFEFNEHWIEEIEKAFFKWENNFIKYIVHEEKEVSRVFSNYLSAKYFSLPLQHEDTLLSSYTYLNHILAIAFFYFCSFVEVFNKEEIGKIASASIAAAEYFYRSVYSGYKVFYPQEYLEGNKNFDFSQLIPRKEVQKYQDEKEHLEEIFTYFKKTFQVLKIKYIDNLPQYIENPLSIPISKQEKRNEVETLSEENLTLLYNLKKEMMEIKERIAIKEKNSREILRSMKLKEKFALSNTEMQIIYLLLLSQVNEEMLRVCTHLWNDFSIRQMPFYFIKIFLSEIEEVEDEEIYKIFSSDSSLLKFRIVIKNENKDFLPQCPEIHHSYTLSLEIEKYLTFRESLLSISQNENKYVIFPKGFIKKIENFLSKENKFKILFILSAEDYEIPLCLQSIVKKPVFIFKSKVFKDESFSQIRNKIWEIARDSILYDSFLLIEEGDYIEGLSKILDEIFKIYPFKIIVTSTKKFFPFDLETEKEVIECQVFDKKYQKITFIRNLPPDIALESAGIFDSIILSYNLSPLRIITVLRESIAKAKLRNYKSPILKEMDIREAIRTQISHRVSEFAESISFAGNWDSLILKEEAKQRLKEIVSTFRHQEKVMREWGFEKKFSYGKGLSALFYGASGTGKTYAASIIAKDLGMELFRIELSRVLDKYIGETEKHLGRIFDEAEKGQVILLFDEADSLFGKRTQVSSSIDRYANIEVNYLLQRMESYEGVVILTTNYEALLDEGFKRRIRFKVHFPIPEEDERERLWMSMLPEEAELGEDISFKTLARKYEMSGGHIKNAILRAAFSAAEKGEKITMKHLVKAADIEYIELGKLVREVV